jgi:hypothetical protein
VPSGQASTAGPAQVSEATLAAFDLKLLSVSDRGSPEVQPGPIPTPSPGDTGYYACTKLAGDEFAAAVGRSFRGPRPNGGRPSSGNQTAKSNCAYETQTSDRASILSLYLTVATYASPDAASQGFISDYGFTPAANIAGIGDGAFIFPNGTPAYVRVGADIMELDLTAPDGLDRAGLYTTLMRDIAGHATSPAPTPVPPTPGPDDLDPCLVTPDEAQKIFHSGPVTIHRRFADQPTDLACVYRLGSDRIVIMETFTAASLRAVAQSVQDRYASDKQAVNGVTDIPGFELPGAPTSNPQSKVAELWGFGNNEQVEIVDNGPVQASGGSGTSRAIPPTPLLDFPVSIPDIAAVDGEPNETIASAFAPSPGTVDD